MQLPTDDNYILGPAILLCPGPRKSSVRPCLYVPQKIGEHNIKVGIHIDATPNIFSPAEIIAITYIL